MKGGDNMNGIKRKVIPQEVFEYQYNHSIDQDDDIKDVENFYNQYEGNDVYKTNGRFVRGY